MNRHKLRSPTCDSVRINFVAMIEHVNVKTRPMFSNLPLSLKNVMHAHLGTFFLLTFVR